MWATLQNSAPPLPAPCGADLFTQCLRLALLSSRQEGRQLRQATGWKLKTLLRLLRLGSQLMVTPKQC